MSRICECGIVKVLDKCPQCDLRLNRPGMRARSIQAKERQRDLCSSKKGQLMSRKEAGMGYIKVTKNSCHV